MCWKEVQLFELLRRTTCKFLKVLSVSGEVVRRGKVLCVSPKWNGRNQPLTEQAGARTYGLGVNLYRVSQHGDDGEM